MGGPAGEVEIFDGAPLAPVPDFTDFGGTTVLSFRAQTFRIRNITPTGADPNVGTLDVSEISVSTPNVFSITSGASLPFKKKAPHGAPCLLEGMVRLTSSSQPPPPLPP